MTHIILQIKMLNGQSITMDNITRHRSNRDFWNDERECYRRLADCPHVPNLISSNTTHLTITTEYAGESLFILTAVQKKTNIKIDKPISQIVKFIDACKQQNIVHLDCHPGNVLLLDGKLSIIDFEKVAIDGKTRNTKMQKKYKKFMGAGGWDWILNRYTKYFENYNNYIWFNEDVLQKGIIKYGKAL